jgi:hypothetical protein
MSDRTVTALMQQTYILHFSEGWEMSIMTKVQIILSLRKSFQQLKGLSLLVTRCHK